MGGFPSIKDAARISIGQAQASGTPALPQDELWMAMAPQVQNGKHWIVQKATYIMNPNSDGVTYAASIADGIWIVDPTLIPLNQNKPVFSGLSTDANAVRFLHFMQQIKAIRCEAYHVNTVAGATFAGFGSTADFFWNSDSDYLVVPGGMALCAFVIPFNAGGIQFQLTLNYLYAQRDNGECE